MLLPWDPGFITNVEKTEDYYFSSTSRSDPHFHLLCQHEPFCGAKPGSTEGSSSGPSLCLGHQVHRSLCRGVLGRRKHLFSLDLTGRLCTVAWWPTLCMVPCWTPTSFLLQKRMGRWTHSCSLSRLPFWRLWIINSGPSLAYSLLPNQGHFPPKGNGPNWRFRRS